MQEESTVLKIPCLTLRENTERPVAVWKGTNKLVKVEELEQEVAEILSGKGRMAQYRHYGMGRLQRGWWVFYLVS